MVFQSEEMDQEIPLNTKIELKLSTGPATTKQVTFGLLEDMVEPYAVKIVRKDTGEVVFEGVLENGESEVTLTLSGRGKVSCEVTVENGRMWEQEVDFETP